MTLQVNRAIYSAIWSMVCSRQTRRLSGTFDVNADKSMNELVKPLISQSPHFSPLLKQTAHSMYITRCSADFRFTVTSGGYSQASMQQNLKGKGGLK